MTSELLKSLRSTDSANAGWLRRLVRRLVIGTILDEDECVALLLACPANLRSAFCKLLVCSTKLSNLALKFLFGFEFLVLRLQKQKLLMERRYLLVKRGLRRCRDRWCWHYWHMFLCFVCAKKSNAAKPPNGPS